MPIKMHTSLQMYALKQLTQIQSCTNSKPSAQETAVLNVHLNHSLKLPTRTRH